MSTPSKAPRRIMALWFPRLPTDRLKRLDGKNDAAPLVVARKEQNALRLSAVDSAAARFGLHVGQPLANARAMVPDIKVAPADGQADLKLLTQIADWCDRFTPFVALDGPCRLLLDVTGVTHLFGDEQAMLNQILVRLRAQCFAIQGAMAGTAAAARALARYKDGTIVSSGEEKQAVRPLPVEALYLDEVTTHALRRAGLKTIGAIAARQRSELVARLGAATQAVLDEALGHATKPITPRRPPPDYWQEQNLAEPLITADAIQTVLRSLTQALVKVLEREGVGVRHLEAVFFRADGAVRRIAIAMGAPTREAENIARLFREKLETLSDPIDPGFGFDLIRLCAFQVERTNSGTSDLDAKTHEQDELNFLVDRLATRFGKRSVFAFHPRDTHIPEEASVVVPAQEAKSSTSLWRKMRKAKAAPRRPLRMFANPESINFETEKHFIWRKVRHDVVHCEGPERIAMEWWRHEAQKPARDYFRVEDSEGKRYWLYCEGIPSQWFLHGVFA